MNENNWINTIKKITMPKQMKKELRRTSLEGGYSRKLFFRCPRLLIAAAALLLLATISIPSYAAYDLYHTKNIEVFFEVGISQERIDAIGEELKAMDGVCAIRFVSADDAWESFTTQYLTEELKSAFPENPLKDSSSYRVTVRLNADTRKVREQIEQIDGVRHLSNLYELKVSDE